MKTKITKESLAKPPRKISEEEYRRTICELVWIIADMSEDMPLPAACDRDDSEEVAVYLSKISDRNLVKE